MRSLNQRDDQIELSIIVLSYNTSSLTQQTITSIITSLLNSNIKYEIIVLDNASKDGSPKMLLELSKNNPSVKLILQTKNLGFSKGNNLAVQKSKGKILLFLNSDIIVTGEAIPKLYKFYIDHQKDIHFVGGKLFNIDKTPQPSCGPFYSLPVVFGALFLKGDYWGLTRQSPTFSKHVDWVSGACIIVSKEIFLKVGGFDENIFMYMEEIDLLYRARDIGYKTYFFAEAEFIHLGSASSQGKTFPIIQVFKGFVYFYKKHHSVFTINALFIMLQLKSLIGILLGKLTKNNYLTETYAEAFKITKVAR